MRAVIDTNVLLSGLLWHGAPHALLEHAHAGTLGLVSSPALLAEAWQLAEVIEPPPLAVPVCRDPAADAVLALMHFQGIPIVTPAQAIQRIEAG